MLNNVANSAKFNKPPGRFATQTQKFLREEKPKEATELLEYLHRKRGRKLQVCGVSVSASSMMQVVEPG